MLKQKIRKQHCFFFSNSNLPGIIGGEGNGTPLQYSCLENPMDGGAWWATIHGVAKSQTQLSDFTFTFPFRASEKEMATHSSVLALRIPETGEPGGLPSMGLHRVWHDWSDLAAAGIIAQISFEKGADRVSRKNNELKFQKGSLSVQVQTEGLHSGVIYIFPERNAGESWTIEKDVMLSILWINMSEINAEKIISSFCPIQNG